MQGAVVLIENVLGFLLLSVVVTAQLHSKSEITSLCKNGEFECTLGDCIQDASKCNGKFDCPDGEDEPFCIGKRRCRIDEFRCNSTMCLPLTNLCDGEVDCLEGIDEANCSTSPQPLSCKVNQFSCSLSGPCIPRASLCNGVGECPNGQDEARCSMIQDIKTSSNITVNFGETVTLTCEAKGYPPPFITWLRGLKPLYHNVRYTLTSYYGYGMLRISEVHMSDAGLYSCVVVSGLYGSTVVQPAISVIVNDAIPNVCEDRQRQKFVEGSYYHSIESVDTGPTSQSAADIVFVVDESGSMATEHEWIRSEVVILDQSLKQQGVGVGEKENLFALVGFGRNDPSAILGVTLSPLTSLEQFLNATKLLVLNGIFEDGYAAINHALETIETRPGTSKLMIFVSDEDREVLRHDLSFNILVQRLKIAGYVLNVAVNQGFFNNENDPHFALGLRGDGQSFIFNQTSPNLFSTSHGQFQSSPNFFDSSSTYNDYVQLSFETQGVAWDLNQLREGGDYSIAFTNAFTKVKIDEVMSSFRFCFVCQCAYPNEICSLRSDILFEDCTGEYTALDVVVNPDLVLVTAKSNASFECLTSVSNFSVSLDVTWEYPNGASIIIDGVKLIVVNVSSSSEGYYRCIVHSSLQRTVTAVGNLIIDTRCHLPDGSYMVLDDIRYILSPISDNTTQAADIILLIDESGSMTMQHKWIPEMVNHLDNALMEVGIGVDPRNRFGVLGFGDCNNETGFGKDVFNQGIDAYVLSENISKLTQALSIGGKYEDGYGSIVSAFQQFSFRDGAKNFILISDEDRDILSSVTRDDVELLLKANNIVLDVVVNQEFAAGDIRAFGINTVKTAYIYDPSLVSFFRAIDHIGAPIHDSAHGSTNEDYTQLAFLVKGGSWDLGLLQQGDEVVRAFTNSFVYDKVVDIQSQMKECLQCYCKADGPICEPATGGTNFSFCAHIPVAPYPTETPLKVKVDGNNIKIKSGVNYTLICRVNSTARISWTFNGGAIPSNTFQNMHHGVNSLLTIYQVNKENQGQYVCLATSPSGNYYNIDLIHMEVYDPFMDFNLILSPIEASFIKGTNNSLSCNVTDSAYFSWKFNNSLLPSNAVVHSISPTSSLLMLYTLDEKNIGAFTCSANSSSIGIVYEDTAYITVSDIRLMLSVNRALIKTNLGARVEIDCTLECDCVDLNISPMWVREDENALPTEITVLKVDTGLNSGITSVLVVTNVTLATTGRYICFAQFGSVTAKKEIYIDLYPMNDTLSVNIHSPSEILVTKGINFSLLCEANLNVTLYWLFNGLPIKDQDSLMDTYNNSSVPLNTIVIHISQQRSLMSIVNVTLENSGVYKCSGSTSEGDVSSDLVSISIEKAQEMTTPKAVIVPTTSSLFLSTNIFDSLTPSSQASITTSLLPVNNLVETPSKQNISPEKRSVYVQQSTSIDFEGN